MNLIIYLPHRLVIAFLTLIGVMIGTFLFLHVIPSDPAAIIAGQNAPEEILEATRQKFGLNAPLPAQFWRYAMRLASGDLGVSLRTGQPIFTELRRCLPATIELATAACAVALCLGIPLGIIAAVKQDTFWDHLIRFFSLAGLSVPTFFFGMGALFLFYYLLDLLPAPGRISLTLSPQTPITGLLLLDSLLYQDAAVFWDALRHLLLPAATLGYLSAAPLIRLTRASMLATLRQEYLRTARVKGLSEYKVICKHALKNALLPILTVSGLMYGALLEGSVITETIFQWNGLGRYIVSAMLESDIQAVLGGVLIVTLMYAFINLMVDLLYCVCNPLIRYV
ncbi:binding-protein-dependent transport systems inner membrane component [Candidatus Moduliflexus flocculans]|uniref:Binding-protein-dependent transport systems inner membrane component n=1 Tax=Candidatus Moduliflexus flocculans TaxID=1499966 RepID=A0A081BPL7_9BACT|nr:binding-protein-dependent transport systems inner membrane component [Candidatus Moduliflexus flocculans]